MNVNDVAEVTRTQVNRKDLKEGGAPVISQRQLFSNQLGVIHGGIGEVSLDDVPTSMIAEQGDVLVSRQWPHDVAVYEGVPAAVLGNVYRVRPRQGVNPYWLMLQLRRGELKTISRFCSSTPAVSVINAKDLRELPIAAATSIQQAEVANQYHRLRARIERAMIALDALS